MEPPTDPAAKQCTATTPTRNAWRWAVIGVIIGACVIGTAWLATAATSDLSGMNSFTLHGTMSLNGGYQDVTSTGPGCHGRGGYSDIADGTSVTVYDARGAVIATGDLENSTGSDTGCEFDILVPNVPAGSKFYQIEVSHRGKITVPATDAENSRVAVSLGS